MLTVTVSPKYQIVIPKEIRNKLQLKPGQKLQLFQIGEKIEFAPIKNTDVLIVSVINIFEVFKKISKVRNEHLALQAIGLMQQAKVIAVNSEISILCVIAVLRKSLRT
mgnify:FL=1